MIETEKEFDECVKQSRGLKISELVGPSPDFLNADYLFNEYNVIAEMKCLEENKIKDEKIREKASKLHEKCLSEQKAPVIVFGRARVSTDGFPEEFTKNIIELYRNPIRGVIKKANKQIRETKEYLNKNDAHGLLILVNDGHTALDPNSMMWILNETFRRDGLTSISSALYFTVNLKAEHPQLHKDILVWIPCYRNPNNKCSEQLLERLSESWFEKVSDRCSCGYYLSRRTRSTQ